MTAQLPVQSPITVSSDMFGERARFDEWRETFMLKTARVDLVAADRTNFHFATRARAFQQLAAVASTYGPAQAVRTKQLLNDGNDDTHLLMVMNGALDIAVGSRVVKIFPGEAALMPIDQVSVINSNTQGSSLRIKISRTAIPAIFGRGGPPLLQAIPAKRAALRLLSIYSRGLIADDSSYDTATSHLAEQQMRELLAHLFAPHSDLAHEAPAGGVRTARLQAIKTDIASKLEQGDLSVATIAAAHRLPIRYVQRLFEAEGTTFTEFLLNERLALAHRILTKSRNADLKVSAVAINAGFGSLSYFNEAFRRRYGASPTDVRAHELRKFN